MKKFLKEIIQDGISTVLSDLKEKYAEEIIFDHYYIKYMVGTKKYALQLAIEDKTDFIHKLEAKLIAKHDLDPSSVNYKVDYIFKL